MLGEVLERLIDDGRWRQIDVSILDAKAARKRQAVPAMQRPSADPRHPPRRSSHSGRVTYRPFIPSGGGLSHS